MTLLALNALAEVSRAPAGARDPAWLTRAVSLGLLGVVFGLALALRIAPLVSNPETRRQGIGIFGDTFLYHQIACNLVDGNGFSGTYYGRSSIPRLGKPTRYEPAVTRGPVYPFFVSLVYRWLGSDGDLQRPGSWPRNLSRVRLVQAVIDALSCFAVFAMTRLMFPAARVPALLAALLFAACPYTIFYTRAILKESLTASLVTWGLLAAVLALTTQRQRWYAAAGIGFGLTALCTPQFLLFPPLFAAFILWVQRRTIRSAGLRAAVFLLVTVAVIAPWTLRNQLVFDRFIPVSTGALGYNLFLGSFESNSNWTGFNQFPSEIFDSPQDRTEILAQRDRFLRAYALGTIDVVEPDAYFFRLALRRFAEDPLGSLALWLQRIPRLWYQFYVQMYADREASGGYFAAYFAFALLAFVAAGRSSRARMAAVVLMFVYLTLIHIPLHIEPRFGVPAIPGILCMTGIGIFVFGTRIKSRLDTARAR